MGATNPYEASTPEKVADQGAADQMPQDLRWFGDGPHGVNHPQHRGDDAERRQGITHGRDGRRPRAHFVMVRLDLGIDDAFHLVGIVRAQRQQS